MISESGFPERKRNQASVRNGWCFSMHRVDREIGCRNSVSPMYGQGKKLPCPITTGRPEHWHPSDSQRDSLRYSGRTFYRESSASCSASAARINPEKRGCGRLGRDFNSGCAWVARNQGWEGSSIISMIRPSGDLPESFRPWLVSAFR